MEFLCPGFIVKTAFKRDVETVIETDDLSSPDSKDTVCDMAEMFCLLGILSDTMHTTTQLVGVNSDVLLKNMIPINVTEQCSASSVRGGNSLTSHTGSPDDNEVRAMWQLMTDLSNKNVPLMIRSQPQTAIAMAICRDNIPANIFRLIGCHRKGLFRIPTVCLRSMAVSLLLVLGIVRRDWKLFDATPRQELLDQADELIQSHFARCAASDTGGDVHHASSLDAGRLLEALMRPCRACKLMYQGEMLNSQIKIG